jgi:hypothetical protein
MTDVTSGLSMNTSAVSGRFRFVRVASLNGTNAARIAAPAIIRSVSIDTIAATRLVGAGSALRQFVLLTVSRHLGEEEGVMTISVTPGTGTTISLWN